MTSTPLDYWINTDFSAPSQVALDNSQGKEKKNGMTYIKVTLTLYIECYSIHLLSRTR